MIWAVAGESEFSTINHLRALREEKCDGQKNWDDDNDPKLGRLVDNLDLPHLRLILCDIHTGYCPTI